MKKTGFTLIELLVVITIIGILSSIAYPLYSDHLIRTRRIYAITALTDLAGRMEEYYVSKNTYDGAALENLHVNNTNYKDYYYLDIITKDNAYVLHAVPLGKQAESDALCGTLILDHNGSRSISGSGSTEECWR
jgi:type IV pilus assembly protein PilE